MTLKKNHTPGTRYDVRANSTTVREARVPDHPFSASGSPRVLSTPSRTRQGVTVCGPTRKKSANNRPPTTFPPSFRLLPIHGRTRKKLENKWQERMRKYTPSCLFRQFQPLFLPVDIQHTQCPRRFFILLIERNKLSGHKTTTQRYYCTL